MLAELAEKRFKDGDGTPQEAATARIDALRAEQDAVRIGFDVPVLAYSAAAVPETLGGAGVQFAPKDMEYAAELLGRLAFDDELRARVISRQRQRLADFGDLRIEHALSRLVAHPGGGYTS